MRSAARVASPATTSVRSSASNFAWAGSIWLTGSSRAARVAWDTWVSRDSARRAVSLTPWPCGLAAFRRCCDRLTQYRDVVEVDVGAGQHQDPVLASGGHGGQQGQLGLSGGGVAVGGTPGGSDLGAGGLSAEVAGHGVGDANDSGLGKGLVQHGMPLHGHGGRCSSSRYERAGIQSQLIRSYLSG